MALPTNKRITQEFGNNFRLPNGQWAYGPGGHNGMDFAVRYEQWGCPSLILRITYVGWDSSGYGNLVKGVDQYGYIHWFAHNSVFLVSVGQSIVLGQPHSISGNTGFSTAPHGHWGVQRPGSTGYNGFINPRDWPGFNEREEVANLSTENHLNKVQAIQGFIYGITGNLHSKKDVEDSHMKFPWGSDAVFSQREKDVLFDKFIASDEWLDSAVRAYTDMYGNKPEHRAEAEKKRKARITVPNLRIELMKNNPK